MVLPYQHPVERLYAGVGMRMNAQHTNPGFLATAFSIPDRLKIRGRTQKYILRRACEGLLSPSILATGKSFNRLKHDTQMSEVLDRLADELLNADAVARRGLFDPGYLSSLRRRAAGPALQPGAGVSPLVAAADRDVGPALPRPAWSGADPPAAAGTPPAGARHPERQRPRCV